MDPHRAARRVSRPGGIPAGTEVPGYQGKFERDSEVEATTVLDDSVLERIVQGHDGEILIDYEHFSHDRDKATAAAGWGAEVRYCANRADGIELGTRWAAPARQEIRDLVYRFVSPEFSGTVTYENGKFRFYPNALTGAGLTNRPKLKTLRPITINRDTNTPATDQPTMNYKSILLKMLSLPETATDDEIQAKVPPAPPADEIASKNREIAGLKAELKTLKDSAIEADLVRFAPVIGESGKEAARELLSMNRDKAVKLFEGQLAKQGGGDANHVHQKNRATPPDGAKYFADGEQQDAAATAKFRAIEARSAVLVKEHNIPFGQAFEMAKAEAGA